jgi:hypothetical protein
VPAVNVFSWFWNILFNKICLQKDLYISVPRCNTPQLLSTVLSSPGNPCENMVFKIRPFSSSDCSKCFTWFVPKIQEKYPFHTLGNIGEISHALLLVLPSVRSCQPFEVISQSDRSSAELRQLNVHYITHYAGGTQAVANAIGQ